MNLPNGITVARIVVCPAIFHLALAPGIPSRYAAFALYLAAALSDVWDGYLARKHGWITDTGKLLDPIADKLLLASTFVPIFLITRRMDGFSELPWWGTLPVWVVVVVFGRELFVTLFRSYAARRGVVIAAGRSGKQKTLLQNFFVGALLLWYPLLLTADTGEWSGWIWITWRFFHSTWIAVTLALAVVLTVLSMCDYLWRYRTLITGSE